MRFGFKVYIVAALAALGLTGVAFADDPISPTQTVCENDQGLILGEQGDYVSHDFIEALDNSKRVTTAVESISSVPAIWLDRFGLLTVTLRGFKDYVRLSDIPHPQNPLCLDFLQNSIVKFSDPLIFGQDQAAAPPYLRIPVVDAGAPHDWTLATYVFNRIFQGCYLDSDSHRWCFADSLIRIQGEEPIKAELTFDRMQKGYPPSGGTALMINDRQNILFLAPVNRGFAVFQSGIPSTMGYKEPDWSHPYTILTAISSNIAPPVAPGFFAPHAPERLGTSPTTPTLPIP